MRLYLRFYLTLIAALAALALATAGLWHGGRLPVMPDGMSLHLSLLWLVVAIGAAAFPLVRQLTRRLERLQLGVESLGRGELGVRVAVEGSDEVARLARSFNAAASTIEQLMRAHKQFLANASHELRTPLARLQLAASLMPGDAARQAQVERDIAALDRLIDEILLASRLDTVTDPLEFEPIDLLAVAAEMAAEHDEVEVSGEPCVLQADLRLVRRLLRNLIDNAVKHGLAPIELSVELWRAEARIVVRDGGPGVAPEEWEKVFKPFYRSPTARPGSGTGLGLALVREIAQRHGGEARCDRCPGGGSQFVVTLPLR